MKPELRLVLFDCDGTLVDSALVIQRAMDDVFVEFSYKPPEFDDIRNIIGLSLDQAIAHLLQREVDDEIYAMVAAFKRHFSTKVHDILCDEPIFPGILDVLSVLENTDNILLGIATGKSRRGIDKICDAYKLNCFIAIKTADDCPSKPDPTMVLESCHETGVPVSQTYIVGDSIYDMQMGKLAGAIAVGVSWGYHTPEALKQAGADFIIDKPQDLLHLLEVEARA